MEGGELVRVVGWAAGEVGHGPGTVFLHDKDGERRLPSLGGVRLHLSIIRK